jgi:cyclopropane fatty-acyl-phospholipid synthase-like methyltransferase
MKKKPLTLPIPQKNKSTKNETVCIKPLFLLTDNSNDIDSHISTQEKNQIPAISSFFHPPQTEEKSSNYTGILPENVILPNFKADTKVLDVGAGDGYMTARLRDELGCDAYALEPNIEVKEGYASCVKRLREDHTFNLTLQDAVDQYPEKFIGQWDAITVFKYNIPGEIKDDFAKQLATCLKPDGILFITSLEEDRVRYNSDSGEHPFIMDSLKRYFNFVQLRDVVTAHCRYGVVECTGPKQEFMHQKQFQP